MDEESNQEDKKISAEKLLESIGASNAVLFHDQYNEGFIAFNGDGSRVSKLNSGEFKKWLSFNSWDTTGELMSPQTVTKITLMLSGMACYDGPQYPLNVRSVMNEQGLWYDCGSGRVVKVDDKGWKMVEKPPIIFKHFGHQKQQDKPVKGGDINKLTDYINLESDSDKLLFLVYVVSAFVPGFPHPLLILYGPQGSGKSTPMRVMKELIDPSSIQGTSAPTDKKEFAQLANHHSFFFFDNLSNMPVWLSDALARVSTGDGFSKRALYTDDDDIVYKLQRTVALNGISQVITKPDLLDRSILVTLERMKPEQRIAEEEFWKFFNDEKPQILGAIFDVLSKALKIWPDTFLESMPRMADFARWGYAIAEAMGRKGDDFIKAYQDNIKLQNDEAIENSPVAQAILTFMEDKDEWEGTAAELLRQLNKVVFTTDIARSPYWPKEPQWLTRRLNEVQPNLITRGITITRFATGHGRMTRITKNAESTVIADNESPDSDDSITAKTVNKSEVVKQNTLDLDKINKFFSE